MRLLLTGLTTGVLVLSACSTPAATLPSPTATVAATSTPTPTPVNKFVFLADLKPSNEVPPITGPEEIGRAHV